MVEVKYEVKPLRHEFAIFDNTRIPPTPCVISQDREKLKELANKLNKEAPHP